MRSLFAIGVTMVIGCGMAVPDQSIPAGSEAGSAAAYRVLKVGSYGMAASEIPSDKIPPPAIVVANDEQAYGAQWKRLIGAEVPPRVDFSRESVVFLLLGNRSSGGYSIEPAAVEVSGDSATVIADVKSPERDSVSTMAITAPFAVLAIDRAGIGNADWIGSDRKQVARSER